MSPAKEIPVSAPSGPCDRTLDRRRFLIRAAASLARPRDRLLIDTHLEVWTIDDRFPFRHPERPEVRPSPVPMCN